MVDRVEGRAQVVQDERNELATVDCADDIVVHDEDSCLSRMVTTIRRKDGGLSKLRYRIQRATGPRLLRDRLRPARLEPRSRDR